MFLASVLLAGCSTSTAETGRTATSTPTAAGRATSPIPSAAPSAAPTVGPDGCRFRRPVASGSVVSVIGDSYTTGEPGKGGVGTKGWPAILAKRTGWTVFKDAQGASGYLSQGFTGKAYDGLVYLDQVRKLPAQHPDLVIVFGSDNDLRHTAPPYFVDKVRQTLQAVHQAVPRAYLVVATSFWEDDAPPPEMRYIRDVEKRETTRIPCAVFLDPIAENWFGAARKDLIVPHDDHPTDAGHVHLANLWQRDLRRLGLLH
jgi:lysophospholipase L1-like esterase